MEPAIDLYAVVLLLGAAHGLFLTLALLHAKGGNLISHRLLALLTLVFSIDLGMEFLDQSRYITRYLKLYIIDLDIDFLFGPLAYLYVRSLTARTGFNFTARHWLHFVPFIIGFLLLSPLIKLDNQQLLSLVYPTGETQDPAVLWAEVSVFIVDIASILQMGTYLVLSIRKLIRHRRIIQDQFSFLERISLAWLRNLLIALAILYLLYIVEIFAIVLFEMDDEIISVHYLMIVFLIYVMGYMGLRQPVIFTRRKLRAPNLEAPVQPASELTTAPSPDPENKKYQRSALDRETSTMLFKDLQTHMTQTKPHLDSKLSLSQLADQLSISSNYLSQVINEQSGQRFFDFINSYRVVEAKQVLARESEEKGNILAIALDAGFNSKSAFYTAFKRHTGQTPTQFRNNVVKLSSKS